MNVAWINSPHVNECGEQENVQSLGFSVKKYGTQHSGTAQNFLSINLTLIGGETYDCRVCASYMTPYKPGFPFCVLVCMLCVLSRAPAVYAQGKV